MGVLRVFVARIPPRVGYFVADFLGDVAHRIAPRSRRSALSNLRHIMPGASREEVIRASRGVFRNVMRNYYDLARALDMKDSEIDSRFDFDEEGWQRVVEHNRRGTGVILIGAHFGAFDMVTHMITRRGLDNVSVLIAQFKPAWLSDWITGMRAARGLRMIMVETEDDSEGVSSVNLAALKEGIRHLRSGGVLGVLADRNTEQIGTWIHFFGHKTRVATGTAKMAIRTRAVMVTALCRRLPGNRFSLEFGPDIEPAGSANDEQDIKKIMQQIFDQYERHFSRSPEQWVLLQPVWPKQIA